MNREFERGAWFAFDTILGWINTQDQKFIDKHHLYKYVMELRPKALAKYRKEEEENENINN